MNEQLRGDEDLLNAIAPRRREALSAMLQNDLRWIPVVDAGRYLGLLTPNRLHAAMRRTVGGDAGNPEVVASG